MSGGVERYRGALVAAACVLLVAGGAQVAARRATPRVAAGWPTVEELDSLRRYLAPVAEAPPLDDYDMYLPAEVPRPAPRIVDAAPLGEAPRLSAILISGESPLAIIDDRPVRRGERLEGGAEVVTIARDHVVIREPGGALRTLRLPTGDEGPHEE